MLINPEKVLITKPVQYQTKVKGPLLAPGKIIMFTAGSPLPVAQAITILDHTGCGFGVCLEFSLKKCHNISLGIGYR